MLYLLFLLSVFLYSPFSHSLMRSDSQQEIRQMVEDNQRAFLALDSVSLDYEVVSVVKPPNVPSKTTDYSTSPRTTVSKKGGNWCMFVHANTLPYYINSPQTTVMNVDSSVGFYFLDKKGTGNLVLSPVGGVLDSVFSGLYLQNLFIDPYVELPKEIRANQQRLLAMNSKGSSDPGYMSIVQQLADNEYEISDEREDISGYECIKLTLTGRDELWLAPVLNYSVVRRVMYYSSDRPGNYVWRIVTNSDYIERSGFFFPAVQVIEDYPDPLHESDRKQWGKLGSTRKLVLHSVKVGGIPDSQFEISPSPGVFVQDMVNNYEYTVHSAGDKPFAEVLTAYGVPDSAKLKSPDSGMFGFQTIAVAVSLLVFSFGSAFLIYRKTKS